MSIMKNGRKRSVWYDCISRCGGNPDEEGWIGLEAEYRYPNKRHYHNLTHVYSCVRLLKSLDVQKSDQIELALWYHDSVYRPGSDDNEQLSASFMQKNAASFCVTEAIIQDASRLILITANHADAIEKDEITMVDIDLSILASAPLDYVDYARRISGEFSHIGIKKYIDGRISFLKRMLDLDFIFRSDWAIALGYNEKAKWNIHGEIEKLNQIRRLDS